MTEPDLNNPDVRQAILAARLAQGNQLIATALTRRHQPHLVAKFPQFPCPMVSRGTSFHADQARRKLGKELQDLAAAQLTTDNNLALLINAMHLKNVLRDIQTDRTNLFHGWFPSCGSNDTAFWHIAMPVGGAIHSINSSH